MQKSTYETGTIKFQTGEHFKWSPDTQTVTYDAERISQPSGKQAFLHELGHALLDHQSADLAVRRKAMEREATAVGILLAESLGVNVA